VKALRVGLAALISLVLVASVVGLLVFGQRRAPALDSAAPVPTTVAVPPGAAMVVCPSELKVPGEGADEVSYDPRFDPYPSEMTSVLRVVVSGPAGGELSTIDGTKTDSIAGPLGLLSNSAGADPVLVTARSAEDELAYATGGVVIHANDKDLRSLAGSSCVLPEAQVYLVGGSTQTGSSTRLLLTNPGLTAVAADIALWDGAGPVDAVGTSGLVVPPQSQRAVLLEGIVPDASRLAVRVTATGGELAVSMQHSRIEALTPAGVDMVVPGSAPALQQVVPGVSVSESKYTDPDTAVVRVLNPDKTAAVVSVVLWGAKGPVSLPGLDEARIAAGTVTDLSLAGLEAGVYAVTITSDQPIVASALAVRHTGPDKPREFAWSPAQAGGSHGYLTMPMAGVKARVSVATEQASKVKLEAVGANGPVGQAKTIELEAGTMAVVDPASLGPAEEIEAIEYTVEGAGEVAIAMVMSLADAGGELITVLVPVGTREAGVNIDVYPAH